MELQTHGAKKYPASALLKSSTGLGWSALSAELRSHGVSETAVIVPQHVELCLVVRGNDNGLVNRTGAAQPEWAIPTTGSIWVCPVGLGAGTISITAPIPETLHLYLSATLFRRLSHDFNLIGEPERSIRYVAGVRDEVIEQIGRSILAEMTEETAANPVFVETAALALAARLIHKYRDTGASSPPSVGVHKLDHARLRRVLDYISAHIADEITVTDLAGIAGLSIFHFARLFTLAVGVSPRRYICRMRLEQAMAEIAGGRSSLAKIAFDARFSSQASFTRAFRRAAGMSPGAYRRRRVIGGAMAVSMVA